MDNFAVPITYLFSDQLLYSSLGVHGQPFGGGRLLEYFRLIHEVLLAGFFTRACVQQQVEGCTMYRTISHTWFSPERPEIERLCELVRHAIPARSLAIPTSKAR